MGYGQVHGTDPRHRRDHTLIARPTAPGDRGRVVDAPNSKPADHVQVDEPHRSISPAGCTIMAAGRRNRLYNRDEPEVKYSKILIMVTILEARPCRVNH